MPASMPMRGFASARVVREPSPQTSPTARFYQCRDRRLAPCCAVCAHEGANGRLRAAAGTSARAPWAHSRRRASGEASHPPRSPLALLRLRMPWQPGTFEEELAPLARALDVITAGERMGI